MEFWLTILSVTLLLLAGALIYTLFRLKMMIERVDSIIKTLDENLPTILEDSKTILKNLKTLLEDSLPLREELASLLKVSNRLLSLFEMVSPDPKGLRSVVEGLKTLISSLFLRFFSKWEGKKDTER
ncbi:MAG: hypothetical protein NZ583_02300 [Desulfobacterota bacterium]|nr:hypothetical protein [Thermodesulfobacteriota bacterium]MDW8001716.1 hypothetical protein [Deltaproteobacteria bacterium]